jgi:hypothetical protein
MKIDEAIEWLRGERSMWNTHAMSSDDHGKNLATCAAEDAAQTERAYWIMRAHKEGLIDTANTCSATREKCD